MTRYIIAGTTEYVSFEHLRKTMNGIINSRDRVVEHIQIICGGREGVECQGQRYAEQEGLRHMTYWPKSKMNSDWVSEFHKMADKAAGADHGVVVWFGRAETESEIAVLEYAKGLGLEIVRG